MNTKAIGYVRCSTDLQEMSIPDQKKAIEAYATKNGLTVIHYFEDKGRSGRNTEDRPAFNKMIEYAKSYDDFRYVLVYDRSRWGRFTDRDESIYWQQDIKRHGKLVKFIMSKSDDTTVGGRIGGMVEDEEASLYSEKLSMLSYRGHKSYAEKGYRVGGGVKFGFDRLLIDESGQPVRVLKTGEGKAKTQHVKLVPNAEQAKIVKMIFDLRTEEKMGIRSIVNRLNTQAIPSPRGGHWSNSTIWGMIHDEIYTGTLVYNRQRFDNLHERDKGWLTRFKPESEWIRCSNAHEAIISKEQFAKVVMDTRQAFKGGAFKPCMGRPHKTPYMLTGIMKCVHCKHNYQGFANRSHGCENFYYRCGGYSMKGEAVCKLWYIPRDEAEKRAIEGIRRRLSNPAWCKNIKKALETCLEALDTTSGSELKDTESRIKDIDRKIDNLLDSIADGVDKGIAIQKVNALKAQRDTLQSRYSVLSRTANVKSDINTDLDEVMSYLTEFEDTIKGDNINLKKAFISKCILKIEVDNRGKKLHYYYLKTPMAKSILEGKLQTLNSDRTLTTSLIKSVRTGII